MRRLFLICALLAVSAPAFAQHKEKLPPFVFDARIALGSLKQSPTTADSLNVLTGLGIITTDDLTGRGLGVSGGFTFYPLRRENFALGIGGELMRVGGTKQNTDTNGVAIGPEVARRLQSLSGQISLNFGHRSGWSYLTGGMGQVAFDTYLKDTVPDGLRPMTINFGGGARWFNLEHVALNIDLRFYQTAPALATLIVAGRDRQSVMVLSAGVSIK